jgi:(p)ppGpp synthase/HD superfamily hydrolase
MIIAAAVFAKRAHLGQVRKYTDRPYIEHPMRVAGRLCLIPDVTEDVVAAGWLHDVPEDCAVPFCQIGVSFNLEVAKLVFELTNPSKNYPELSRPLKKSLDRKWLKQVSRWAKIIKLVDRIDNLGELPMVHSDARAFAPIYSGESLLLAEALNDTDPIIQCLIGELKVAVSNLRRA